MKTTIIFILSAVLLAIATEPRKKSVSLNKNTAIDDPLLNRARAYLDKGKLKLAVENYGIFSGTASPQGLWGNYQYISNLSLVVGVPGKDKNGNPYPWAVGPKEQFNVATQSFFTMGEDTTYWGATTSEAWFDRTGNLNRTDWEAVEDHRVRLHNPMATAGEYYGKLDLYTNEEDQYPLIATSDIPDTWPGTDEQRFWPGPWASDPDDSTGQKTLEGVFVSDQDIYFEFDDRLATRDVDPNQGYSIGIRAKVSAFSYGTSVAEDIIFFKMYLFNDSPKYFNDGKGYTYKNVYAGFYFDVDSYNLQANGSPWGRTNDDDMMSYNTEWDFGYIYDLDGDHTNPYVGDNKLAYSAVKLLETPLATEDVDLDGDGYADIQQGDVLGLTSWHWFDWYFRPGARDVSPTDGPFSGDGQTQVADNKEEIQYKIMAGDTSNLTSYDSEHYFHPYRSEVGVGDINPRFDSVEGLSYEYEDGLDCVFIMASGPFELAPGDSVPFSFCILMGDDEKDLVSNATIAQLMYDHNYQGARAPKAPNVTAKEGDEEVTLYWDNVSVTDDDILTGYYDFEGFRIYRSEDNGKTWGTKMYDEESKTTYWEPIAQYDLDNEFEGYEPLKPHRYLGNNSGLQYQYVDTDVENGREYLYAVCAYDHGFIPSDSLYDPENRAESKNLQSLIVPSLENLLSNSTNLSHIVKAIPHRPASNAVLEDLEVKRLEGTVGNGIFSVEVVDPTAVTGDVYEISFDCDYSDPPNNTRIVKNSQRYTITNTNTGDTLVKDSDKWYSVDQVLEAPPVYDGLRWGIQMSPSIEAFKEDAYWTENSQCTYKIKTLRTVTLTRSNYELRFIAENADTAWKNPAFSTARFTIPFQMWNTTTNRKVKLLGLNTDEFKPDPDSDKGVLFGVFDNHLPEDPDNERYKTVLQFSLDWILPGTYKDGKLIPPDKDWAAGDTLVMPIRIPFERGDGFTVNTAKVFQLNKVDKRNIKKVKVVPNPYIVSAAWERDILTRKLLFINLPPRCHIKIFTVSGEHIVTLHHDNPTVGHIQWNFRTKEGTEVAYGLYIYKVESEWGDSIGKFAIIR